MIHWLTECRVKTCDDVKKRCPICGNYGHIITHSEKGLEYEVFQHVHFIVDKDKGRNIFHRTGDFIKPPSHDVIESRITTREGKKRIKERFLRKYK